MTAFASALLPLLLPVSQPPPPRDAYAQGAWVDFRQGGGPHGLQVMPGAEGATEVGQVAGQPCLETNADTKAYYVYLQTPRDFVRTDRDTLTFEVEYYDNGRGPIILQIDSALPAVPKGGFNYRAAPAVWRTDSKEWKWAVWQVTDDAFADPGRGAVRCRLFAEEWMPDERRLHIGAAAVTHAAIRMKPPAEVVLAGMTCPVDLEAYNEAGEPLPDGTEVLLEVEPPDSAVARPAQVALRDGRGRFEVRAGEVAGTVWIRASAGETSASVPLHVVTGEGPVEERTLTIGPGDIARGAQFVADSVVEGSVTPPAPADGAVECAFTRRAQGDWARLSLNVPVPGLPRRFCVRAGCPDGSIDGAMLDLLDRDGEVFAYVLDPMGFGPLRAVEDLCLDARAISYPTFGSPHVNGVIDLPCSFRSLRFAPVEGKPQGRLTIASIEVDVVAPAR
jgi:hypothetical protein